MGIVYLLTEWIEFCGVCGTGAGQRPSTPQKQRTGGGGDDDERGRGGDERAGGVDGSWVATVHPTGTPCRRPSVTRPLTRPLTLFVRSPGGFGEALQLGRRGPPEFLCGSGSDDGRVLNVIISS